MTLSISPTLKTEYTPTQPHWKPATWEEYEAYRDDPTTERVKLFYYQGKIFVEMGGEGINHANAARLFTMLFAFWFQKTGQKFNDFGGVLLEKPNQKAASPDLVLYVGEDYPRWKPGERRYIDLDRWRIPNLVGEISDTTLATDLDEKKHLYAELGITEYWVVDVRGGQIIAFQLQENGSYLQCEESVVFQGLSISLLQQTLDRWYQEGNGNAALWFSQQIASLKSE